MHEVPEHFPMEVNSDMQGPLWYDEQAAAVICWCKDGPLCTIIRATYFDIDTTQNSPSHGDLGPSVEDF
jgi:hypothetical protein